MMSICVRKSKKIFMPSFFVGGLLLKKVSSIKTGTGTEKSILKLSGSIYQRGYSSFKEWAILCTLTSSDIEQLFNNMFNDIYLREPSNKSDYKSKTPLNEFSPVGMQITIVKSKSGNLIRKDTQTSLKEKLVSSGYLDLFDWGIETSSGLKSELEKCHTGGLIFQDLGEEVKKVMEESEKKLQNMFSKFDNEDAICVSELIPEKKRKFNIFLTEVLTLLVTKQVQFIRKKNIEHFKDTLYSSEQPSELLFEDACDNFKRDCEASFYQSIGWNTFDDEYSVFREILLDIVYRHKQLITEKLQNSERESVALNLLQMQQAQLHAIQQQQYGGGPGNWNIGIAYRPLRSNVNISLGYQQGRANIQVSMVPEEQAGLLGPNGFTAGVGPGNLGVSFNISL